MSALDTIISKAKTSPQKIVLPEAHDPRIVSAANLANQAGIAHPVLIGDTDTVVKIARQSGINPDSLNIVNPALSDHLHAYGNRLFELRKHKGMTQEQAAKLVGQPLMYANMMLRESAADGCVAGAVHTTSEVIRTALQVIGMRKTSELVSSFFLMDHQKPHQAVKGAVLYADCAMVIDPSETQLAAIAIDTAENAQSLLGVDPTVALLSFSTAGSAQHPNVDKVRNAGVIIESTRPKIDLMTEVQFDAAISPEIRQVKAPEMKTLGAANVFVFPDLQSGNIGYKIAQRIGGVEAIGPVIQGLNQPVNDLSRGCSSSDVFNLIAVTCVQAQQT
ncbi:MAG: phosphate acetyltransferase [Pseudomonadota bacterium]